MKINKKFIWGSIVTTVLLFILFRFVSWAEIWDTLQKLPLQALLVAFVVYFFVYFFRTWRYYTLNLKNVKFYRLFSIIGLYNMVNVFLPFKTGEIGYAYLLRRDGIDYRQGIATLIIARLFDVFSILLIFFVAFLFNWSSTIYLENISKIIPRPDSSYNRGKIAVITLGL